MSDQNIGAAAAAAAECHNTGRLTRDEVLTYTANMVSEESGVNGWQMMGETFISDRDGTPFKYPVFVTNFRYGTESIMKKDDAFLDSRCDRLLAIVSEL